MMTIVKVKVALVSLAALLVCSVATADRVAGIAGIPPARAAAPPQANVVQPALQSGAVSAVRADGTQVEIDGKWYVLKQGRSMVLRGGLPVGAGALAKGQKLSFRLASTTPGETALGVVHVP